MYYYIKENRKVRGSKLMLYASKNYNKWNIISKLTECFSIADSVKEGDLFLTENSVHDKLGYDLLGELPLRKADKSYADRSEQQRQSFYILKPDVDIYPEE